MFNATLLKKQLSSYLKAIGVTTKYRVLMCHTGLRVTFKNGKVLEVYLTNDDAIDIRWDRETPACGFFYVSTEKQLIQHLERRP